MSTFPDTSTTLLVKLAARETGVDQAAWFRFFALYQPVMVEFARLRGAGDDAEDVVQDVFADLAKTFQAGRYAREKGSFRAYLATMLRNELISRFRRKQAKSRVDGRARTPAAPLAAPSADDLPVWNLARHRAAVEHVLTKTALSEQSRRIYRELLATGDNCAKVARRMGLPAATVRQVKSRVSRMIAAFENATK
ncbi:MAG: sigma-70 family RNA polymerase sigma factor [Kiritimatiellae bacterium]|nr:sigma-70 family RNA polymerase sigma factor [Kiritimatiellia bacterium]MBQ6330473.1 sigma-70 family RNA polymerase sigma factor [Kiritimatiellia bacterium]